MRLLSGRSPVIRHTHTLLQQLRQRTQLPPQGEEEPATASNSEQKASELAPVHTGMVVLWVT